MSERFPTDPNCPAPTVERPKFTPGPWSARLVSRFAEGEGGAAAIDSAGWSELATVYQHCTGAEAGEANAALISAAPELLASLTRLLAHFDGTQMADPEAFPGIAETLREARLAVAKATTVFPW